VSGEFTLVGEGQNVFESEAVEGRARWIDSPQEMLELVSGGDLGDVIVVSRGGTTTFVAPILSAGVRGLITLQGGPESHLGIVSREFSIPCIMSVAFTDGVQTDRGETVPADGTVLRLETSTTPRGEVYAQVVT
jgi:phosphoenolpyruvate-protein kinase (PTS system EI component)